MVIDKVSAIYTMPFSSRDNQYAQLKELAKAEETSMSELI
jgi:hypothetical protein